jgi:protein-S-isoprenylcysteine O-methyltransferase Ste14
MWLFTKNLLFTLIVPGTVAVYVPRLLIGDVVTPAPLWRAAQFFAVDCWVLGAVLYLACVWHFAVTGGGTPAPIDAPKRLVVLGPYRYVRNPMYVAVLLVILGWALFFEAASLFWYTALVAIAFHTVVLLVEEPMLRRQFGAQYDDYRSAVRRWWPGRPYGARL